MFDKNPRLIVGGELTYSPALLISRPYNQFSCYGSELSAYKRHYTFGAYYSFKAIIEHLKLEYQDKVLLPAYLCPSMIMPFREAGVRYDFFKIKEGLIPDLQDIDRKLNKDVRAILFIDYFGIPQREEVIPILDALRANGTVTIQDTVQSWLDNEIDLYADYCVNSVRKYTPFEASVLLAKHEIPLSEKHCSMHKFLRHKRWAQLLRYLHIQYGWFSAHAFLKHIDISNAEYHKEGIAQMPQINRWLLDRMDFVSLGKLRRSVYNELRANLSLKTLIKPAIGDAVPLGMAVYLNDRDAKKSALHQRDIHCPLHWRLSDEIDRKEHEFCWDIEQHALTLPVNVPSANISKYIKILQEVLK